MRVLSIVHEDGGGPGLFGKTVADLGFEHVEWRVDLEPRLPVDRVDAVMVFGGTMNTHEEDDYPWLRDEDAAIRRLVAEGVPVLGVCLGGQLLAKALDAKVSPAPEPEIGWHEVIQTPEARVDPVFEHLPERFASLQWHHYQFDLPRGAVPLARSRVCLQAYRFGETAWGVQFHPEVSRETLQDWIEYSKAAGSELDFDRFEEDSDRHIAEWVRIGRAISEGFLRVAKSRAR